MQIWEIGGYQNGVQNVTKQSNYIANVQNIII